MKERKEGKLTCGDQMWKISYIEKESINLVGLLIALLSRELNWENNINNLSNRIIMPHNTGTSILQIKKCSGNQEVELKM